MNLVNLGLIVIAFAWLVQLSFVTAGDKKIQPIFIIIYILGVLMLVSGSSWDIYQIMTMVAALLVLARLVTLKK